MAISAVLTKPPRSGIFTGTHVSRLRWGIGMTEARPSSGEPKEKQRRGYSSLDAIDPNDGGKWQVLLQDGKMDYVARLGLGAAMELADTVRWSLLHPRALFRGVRDLDRDIAEKDWLCYVAVPGHAYDHKTGNKRPAWPGEVFLVFVTDERVVYTWYWCECDQQQSHLPVDYENRFTEKVW
jgi:hypothetical protein